MSRVNRFIFRSTPFKKAITPQDPKQLSGIKQKNKSLKNYCSMVY